jgi:hypothetical protein
MKESSSKETVDNRANQLNREHPAYYRSRGLSVHDAATEAAKANLENRLQETNTKTEIPQ